MPQPVASRNLRDKLEPIAETMLFCRRHYDFAYFIEKSETEKNYINVRNMNKTYFIIRTSVSWKIDTVF